MEISPAVPTPATEASKLETAAKQFESYFLRRMFAEVRSSSKSKLLDGGFAGGMFRQMLDDAFADNMSDAGGIGIGDMLVNQMSNAGPPADSGDSTMAQLGDRAKVTGVRRPVRVPASYRSESGLSVSPVAGRRSSQFGRRTDPINGKSSFHGGMDIAAATGTPVAAAGAGVVVHAGKRGGYGNLVVVDHGGGMRTRYGHLNEVNVAKGDRVNAGAVVGTVGATGRATGPHLHFEVRRNGTAVDPVRELPGAGKTQ